MLQGRTFPNAFWGEVLVNYAKWKKNTLTLAWWLSYRGCWWGTRIPVEKSLHWICWCHDLEQHKAMPAISVEELFPTRKQKNLDNSIVESVLGMIITIPHLLKKLFSYVLLRFYLQKRYPCFLAPCTLINLQSRQKFAMNSEGFHSPCSFVSHFSVQ